LAEATPFVVVPGGVNVTVRLTPKASENRIGPVVRDADGGAAVKVTVTQPPADGKANKALITLLAKSWGLPKTAISVKRGAKDRLKTLFIAGGTEDLIRRLPKDL